MNKARKKEGAPMAVADAPLFPPEQAFVVQFTASNEGAGARCIGRVEHVISGRSSRFDSVEGLLDFMDQMRRQIAKT
jgi:hypothetical protein